MLISAQILSIEPFSNIIFEEVFFGDLPIAVNIDASEDLSIIANVIKSVVPEEIDANEITDFVANKIKNTEEITIDAAAETTISGSAKAFISADIDAAAETDFIGSLIAGLYVGIDGASETQIIANRLRSIVVSADFSESVNITASLKLNLTDLLINSSATTSIVANRIDNLIDVLLGSNIRLDSNNVILRNVDVEDLGLWQYDDGRFIPNPNSGKLDENWQVDSLGRIYPVVDTLGFGKFSMWNTDEESRKILDVSKTKKYRESVGTKFSASIVKNAFIDMNVTPTSDVICNVIKNLEEMSIDASVDVAIDANVL